MNSLLRTPKQAYYNDEEFFLMVILNPNRLMQNRWRDVVLMAVLEHVRSVRSFRFRV